MTQIPSPPSDTPDKPDIYTSRATDQTGPTAKDRIFYLNFGILRFGTNDKIQGAAILFAILIFISYIGVVLYSISINQNDLKASVLDKALSALWNGFLLTIGVALGRGMNNHNG
jgi:hypothetical protein